MRRPRARLAGLKTFAWTPGGTPFLVVLMTIHEPEIVAVLEADTLGQLRTAAASAVAAKHLARDGAASLGVIGCGRQAASHVAALRAQLPSLERVVVYCRDAGSRDAFCREHDCEPATSAQAAGGCDVVVTATTASHAGAARASGCSDGALVLAVGANDPGRARARRRGARARCSVYVDSREQAREEAGDLIEPASRGRVRWEDVHELQDVVAGTVDGATVRAEDDVSLFKSSGLAAWDLAVAAARCGRARALAQPATLCRRARRRDDVVADRVDHVVPLEDAPDLLGAAAVRDVVVLEDLGRAAGRDGARGSRTARCDPRRWNGSAGTRTLPRLPP